MTGVALAWSAGKDSALALRALRDEHGIEPLALVTTVDESDGRVGMHGVGAGLLRRQAAQTGIPLVEVALPWPCPDDVYADRFAAALAAPPLDAAETVAFGDLFLADVRAWREERMAAIGRRPLFPLWGRDTAALARDFVASGFEATVVCVDAEQADPGLAGARFDAALLDALGAGVDPCGERGEFHTFVHAGPVLRAPVPCTAGPVRRDGRFARCDLLPAG